MEEPKKFKNARECLNYLRYKAKKGEVVILIEEANAINRERRHIFMKPYLKKQLKGGKFK